MLKPWLACLALLRVLCLAPAESAAQADPIKLGFSNVLTGIWASWGNELRQGVGLAAKNLGAKFDIDYQDDHADAAACLTNVQRFLNSGIRLILIAAVENVEAVAPAAQKRGAIVFCLGGVFDAIRKAYPNVISVNNDPDAEALFLAPYLAARGDVKTAVVIHGSNNYGEVLGATVARQLAEHGIKILGQESVPIDSTDFRAFLPRLLKGKPDIVFAHQSENTLLVLIRQLREAGHRGEIYTNLAIESDATRRSMASYLEGVHYTYPVVPAEQEPVRREFVERFRAAYHQEPGQVSATGYDALNLINQAVGQCGASDTACLSRYFLTPRDYSGAAGKMTLTPTSVVRPFGIKEIRNGDFVWVTKDVKR